jgi:hypothetical protein
MGGNNKMKKLLLFILSIMVIGTLVFVGCAEPEEPAQPTPEPTPEPAAPTPEPTPEPAAPGPVSGGTVRVINANGVNVMGYSLEQTPWDLFVLLCGVEKLMEYDEK